MSKTSKILMAGLVGTAAFLIVRKIVRENRDILDDIFFDSEFLPGTQGNYQPIREHAQRLPVRHVEDDSDELFV